MQRLGAAVAVFALVALAVGLHKGDSSLHLLAAAALLAAYTTWRSATISSFLQIFVRIFSIEVIAFGLSHLAVAEGLVPESLAPYALPESMPLTVAVFSIIVFAVSHIPVVREMTRIADLYFDSPDRGEARVWPNFRFRARERDIAIAMIVLLVLLNQAQVGINVRLSYQNRDMFNAIQDKNAAEFWRQLLYVFTPWAFVYVISAVIEYVVQSLMIIRWRRWLTHHYVFRWLADHTHYRMALSGAQTDNPDQRIAEDVNRFIDGGTDGYGIYSYSILLISTLSSLVSFSIVLWDLSGNFTVPGTELYVPGFLFWVVLIYATIGTVVTHLLGRTLSGLFFERQHREADFRFSLARLREYSEQVALLSGENAERASLVTRFAAIIQNFMRIIITRKKMISFTATYGQASSIIPYVLTAPFYFSGKINLGVMTQTARAFDHVEGALTFFITYYTSLANFKSVLDRLSSFDEAIERAAELETHAPKNERSPSRDIETAGLALSLPDGRRIVEAPDLVLHAGRSTLLTGPSGSGKSTLFRAIAGIWPYGEGAVRTPEGAQILLLPQKPYIPIGPLADVVAYPNTPDAFPRRAIEEALDAARLAPLKFRLDEDGSWGQRLSGGEQQRIAIARALLAEPNWLFLDEATSALDETLESEIYTMLRERLPNTTIVSIGHRSSLHAFHERHVSMEAGADGVFTPRETVAA
jgi:putative ATP-binding cassette transporter